MRIFDPVKDYYQVLGVDRQANAQQIKRAYHSRARTLHPDLGGCPAEMRDLNEAFEILSDESTRKAYDSVGRVPDDNRSRDSKREAPLRTESLGMGRPDRDLLWLTTRGIICALLAVLWLLVVEEGSPHRRSVALPWFMRGMSIATLGVGILFGYSAHRLAQQKMSHKHLPRPEKHLLMCKSIFRAVIGGFLGFLILSVFLSN